MALNYLANTNRSFAFTAKGASGATSISNFSFSHSASSKCKMNSKGVLKTSISWTVPVSSCLKPDVWADCQNLGGGSGSMTASSSKVKADGSNVCTQGLSGTCSCQMWYWWPYWVYYGVVNCTIQLSSAGQSKVKAN